MQSNSDQGLCEAANSPWSEETQTHEGQVETVFHVDEALTQRGTEVEIAWGNKVGEVTPKGLTCSKPTSILWVISRSIFSECVGSSPFPHHLVIAPGPRMLSRNDFILEDHILNPTQIKADTLFREWLTSTRNAASSSWPVYLESPKTVLILTLPGRTPPIMQSPRQCHLSKGLGLLSRSCRQEMKTSP